MDRAETLPATPLDFLRQTNASLASTIGTVLGAPPRLEVVRQRRVDAPHPSWIVPPLAEDALVLERWTRYVLGRAEVSRNVAYVDLGRLEVELAARLWSRDVTLGEVFARQGVEKFGHEFGTDADAREIDPLLVDEEIWGPSRHRPYVWRRYAASIRGTVAFVVVESLPRRAWKRLLASRDEPAPPEGGKG